MSNSRFCSEADQAPISKSIWQRILLSLLPPFQVKSYLDCYVLSSRIQMLFRSSGFYNFHDYNLMGLNTIYFEFFNVCKSRYLVSFLPEMLKIINI
ncbi:hypothetical protein CMV_012237 [Castanea mollissima]|uniref:Uncharacterized protein n=1 Tax=Castanea mollissima TaxID=60419 RepID=A0A8J4RBD6_9ROSI|nr:hypothetical protein CMV_012237 [Castanea mollissima]